jgi:hypothetical protein
MISLERWRARGRPPTWLLVLAAVGASLLAATAFYYWPAAQDESAYWYAAQRLLAGQPLYDPTAFVQTPYAFWNPPIVAQFLAPLTLVLSQDAYIALWTAVLVGALWWLCGRDPIVSLAAVAFLPVALELDVRNMHILIAALVVLALRRSWAWWVPAVALKIAPILGVFYLAAAGRHSDALKVLGLGALVAAISVVLAPDAWLGFWEVVVARAAADGGGIVSIPYPLRFGVGVGLALLAGRRGGRRGEALLVVAILIANPTLWVNAFSQLVALIPILWSAGGSETQPRSAGAGAGERQVSQR